MIHAVRWDPATGAARPVAPADLPGSHADLPADAVLWVDLEAPTSEEEDRVLGGAGLLPVHPLTLADVTKPRRDPDEGAHLPKVEEFHDYLFVVVNPLPPDLDRPAAGPSALAGSVRTKFSKLYRPQLSAVVTRNVLVTHHYDPLPAVAEVRAYAERHQECGRRGPDYLFHLVLDGMVDAYAPVVERVADRLDALEGRLFRRPTPDVLAKLLRLKRRVSFLRKTLILEREVLSRLVRGEFALIDAREVAYYRNVYDHLVRYTELIEGAREMVSDLMQTHLSAVSNRLNESMRLLTTFSAVILPMTLISGVYGMNFEDMPELHTRWGYPSALGLMALTGLASFLYFRWRRL